MITVIGGSDATRKNLSLAEEVGRELAYHGATVVCGGLGGVMEAVCRGAKAAGGLTVGILPGNNPSEANPYVDIPVCTGMGYARNALVVKSGRAVIAIDGNFGTLSEIGHALGEGIPVIGLNTWSLSMDGKQERSIIQARDAKEAVERALEAARQRAPQT
ncbi:MAG: TIGR00725 family protein [Dehalococcoidia bacterium]